MPDLLFVKILWKLQPYFNILDDTKALLAIKKQILSTMPIETAFILSINNLFIMGFMSFLVPFIWRYREISYEYFDNPIVNWIVSHVIKSAAGYLITLFFLCFFDTAIGIAVLLNPIELIELFEP